MRDYIIFFPWEVHWMYWIFLVDPTTAGESDSDGISSEQIISNWRKNKIEKRLARKSGAKARGEARVNRVTDEINSKMTSLYYGPDTEHQALRTIGDKTVLYVVGHCSAKDKAMSPSPGGAKSISHKELARRLSTSGLRTDFSGTIKIYGCQSGTVVTGTPRITSFVEKVATEMAEKYDYKSCTFTGYTRYVTGMYVMSRHERERHPDGMTSTLINEPW